MIHQDEALRSGLVRVFEALGLTLGKQVPPTTSAPVVTHRQMQCPPHDWLAGCQGEEEEEGYGLVSGAGRSEQRARVRELIVRNGGTVDQDHDDDDEEEEEAAAAKEGAGQEVGRTKRMDGGG